MGAKQGQRTCTQSLHGETEIGETTGACEALPRTTQRTDIERVGGTSLGCGGRSSAASHSLLMTFTGARFIVNVAMP